MDFGLKGKNALILASSKGLGKAVAKELIQEGANVFLCSRNEDVLKETASNIGAAGYAVGDISKSADRLNIVEEAMQSNDDIKTKVRKHHSFNHPNNDKNSDTKQLRMTTLIDHFLLIMSANKKLDTSQKQISYK